MKKETPMIWLNGMLFVLLVVFAVGCAPATTGSVASENAVSSVISDGLETITVVGHGQAFGEPDEAQINIGVDTFAAQVNEATSENEDAIQAVLEALSEQGIKDEDIQTSNYSLWAEQKYGESGPEGIAGYRVSNQVSVKIRDIKKVGDILAATTAAGANNIYGVTFSVADPAALEAQAREEAIGDAQTRAESLAQLSNLALGEIRSVSEVPTNQLYGPAAGLGGGGGGGEAASISPGQLSYQSQVEVVFNVGQ